MRALALLLLAITHLAAEPPRDLFGGLITEPTELDAWHQGTVKAVEPQRLVLEGVTLRPGAVVGKVVNPNFARPIGADGLCCDRYYRIVANTADTLTTDPADGRLDEFARPGDRFLLAGFFRLAKKGARWFMVDPLDHPFFAMGPCTLNPNLFGYLPPEALRTKYGTLDAWWRKQVERIRGLGWTASMGYSYANFDAHQPRLPYFRMCRAAENEGARWPARGGRGWLDSPLKNFLEGLHGRDFVDVFDPHFAQAYGAGINHNWGPGEHSANNPWVIGYITEEPDNLFGLLRPQFHLGWCALAAKPFLPVGRRGIEYSDPKVYTKFAARDFLRERYNTIEALNAAWGAHYTTWDSAGGWGQGSGVLDEDGKLGAAWLGAPMVDGKPHNLDGANPRARADLDAFKRRLTERFYRCEVEGLKAHSPNHLVMGWCNETTDPDDYWAEARWVDLTFSAPPKVVLALTDTGGRDIRPCLMPAYLTADQDSALADYYAPGAKFVWRNPGSYFRSQAERGQAYADQLLAAFEQRAGDGSQLLVGAAWWAWGDDQAEKRNWGLCSFLDNLYDGQEATRAHGEAADYGDCCTPLRRANEQVLAKLATAWSQR